jgi:hypothetical protein
LLALDGWRNWDKRMSKQQYSKYQQEVIGRYYENFDGIMLQKLSELVTELYLADGQPRQQQLWKRAEKAMAGLKVPLPIMQHILQKKSVEVLARNLEHWLRQARKK